jgi:3-oxoacyl-[acyl-carrier-protein] synthase II
VGPVRALLGRAVRTTAPDLVAAELSGLAPGGSLWLTADGRPAPEGARPLDLTGHGELSGAHGVVQCAAAVGWFAEGHPGPAYVQLGTAGLALLAPGETP